MTFQQAAEMVSILQRNLRVDGTSRSVRIGNTKVEVLLTRWPPGYKGHEEREFTYYISGVEFTLRQLEHALMLAEA